MTERLRSASTVGYHFSTTNTKMENDLSPRKTMLVLVIVVGCFAVLWPKVFYPILMGSVNQHIKPSPIDKTTGCCDVISEIDVNTIKIMNELCGNIIKTKEDNKPLSGKEIVQRCRQEILETCGIDISPVLQEQVRLGQNVKLILDQIRSLNGSLCLKYNFGVAPWRLGVPHRINVKISTNLNNIRQERPLHLRSELIHPAFRERGRAIPQSSPSPQMRPPVSRVVEGRPGPIPGMRPTIGGPGHIVPPAKQGITFMGFLMPMYTIGIVIFFTYTLTRMLFKRQPEGVGNGLYPPVEPDPHFRREVFEQNKSRLQPRTASKDNYGNKLGDEELDLLRQRLRETELAMERIVEQMAKVPLKSQDLANGSLKNGDAPKPHDEEQPKVKVMGMEMTASCEGGEKWSRPDSPVLPTSPPPPIQEPPSPPQEIYLEGSLPAQSHLLVADSAIEPQPTVGEDPAIVLAGKMTLSVVSLDSSDNGDANTKQEPIKGRLESQGNIDLTNKELLMLEKQFSNEPQIERIVEGASVEKEEQVTDLDVETISNTQTEVADTIESPVEQKNIEQNLAELKEGSEKIIELSSPIEQNIVEEEKKIVDSLVEQNVITESVESEQKIEDELSSPIEQNIVEEKEIVETVTTEPIQSEQKFETEKMSIPSVTFSDSDQKEEVPVEEVVQEVDNLIEQAVQQIESLQALNIEEQNEATDEEEVEEEEEEVEEIEVEYSEESGAEDERPSNPNQANDARNLNGEIGTEESKHTTTASNTAAENDVSVRTDAEEEIVEEVAVDEEEEVEEEEEEEEEVEEEEEEAEEEEIEIEEEDEEEIVLESHNKINNISGESEED